MVAVRFVVLPPLGIAMVKAARHFGIVKSNPLYEFTLMLQFAVPPAMNIGQLFINESAAQPISHLCVYNFNYIIYYCCSVGTIAQLVKSGESECAVIMLWTYAVAAVFLTLWSAFFIWLVSS